jgi:hypothetical protein
MATCELAVTLSPQQVQQLHAGAAVVQLWCLKLGDSVPYRVHWPYTNQQLQVNDARAIPTMAKRLQVGELQPHQVRWLAGNVIDLVGESSACWYMWHAGCAHRVRIACVGFEHAQPFM